MCIIATLREGETGGVVLETGGPRPDPPRYFMADELVDMLVRTRDFWRRWNGRSHAEEIAPTGERTGNFPQALSHLSLISTATSLDRMLDAPEPILT